MEMYYIDHIDVKRGIRGSINIYLHMHFTLYMLYHECQNCPGCRFFPETDVEKSHCMESRPRSDPRDQPLDCVFPLKNSK